MKLVRTLTKLEETLKTERVIAPNSGMYGLDACKNSIRFHVEVLHESLEEIYLNLIKQAMTDVCFNTYMIVACEQMMEEAKKEN